jgi:hypothetical protein
MSRGRLILITTLFAVLTFTPFASQAGSLILDLRGDPLDSSAGSPALWIEGPGTEQFTFDAATARAFPSDGAGSLLAEIDSVQPTTRAVAPLDLVYTQDDDFVFGAVLSIRPEGFEPDPFGFHPIALSLINSATTGLNRTGTLADFRSDTFDTVELAYFPQVSPIFGGPFVSPTVFGSPVSDDAFANFAFGTSPFELIPGMPYLLTVEHSAARRGLLVTVYGLGGGGRPVPLPGGEVLADLSSLAGFAVDTLAISSYEDGFNIFSSSGRSLGAAVDYHRIFFVEGSLDGRDPAGSLMGILRRSGQGAAGPSRP